MTQEIFNYLYIRKTILSGVGIDLDEENESEVYSLALTVLKLVREEPIFLGETIVGTIYDFVKDCRSKFSHSSEIMVCMNDIVLTINKDNLKDDDESELELAMWLDKEYSDRCLPIKYRYWDIISTSIYDDPAFYLGLVTNNYGYLKIVEFLGSINLLINRYPTAFEDTKVVENAIEVCKALSKHADRTELRYIKTTIRNLKKLNKKEMPKLRQLNWIVAK